MTFNGTPVAITIESRSDNGYGENTIVWRPTSMGSGDAWPKPTTDATYRVRITNGVIGGVSQTIEYDVTVFDPDVAGPTPSATATVTRTPTVTATPTPTLTPTATQTSTPTVTATVSATTAPSVTPTLIPGGFAPGQAVRTVANLNLRSSPSTSGAVLAVLPAGTRGTVLGHPVIANGFTWYEVEMPGYPQGWVAGEYLTSDEATATPSPTSSPTATRTATLTATATRTPTPTSTATVGLTSTATATVAPTSAATATRTATPSPSPTRTATLTPTSQPPTATATTLPGEFAVGDQVETTANLNLRSSPSTSGSVLAVLPAGTRGNVTGAPVSANGLVWYPVSMPGYPAGWVAGQYLRKVIAAPTATSTLSVVPTATNTRTASLTPTATVTRTPTSTGGMSVGSSVRTTANLNLRSSPSTSGSVLAVLPAGTTGTIIGGPQSANGFVWYQVNMPGYPQGWVAGQYLQPVGGSGPTATVTTAPTATRTPTTSTGGFAVGEGVQTTVGLNLRSGPSTTASVLAVLPAGTQGTVTGAPVQANGFTWYPVTMPGYPSGWVAGNYLRQAPVSTAGSSEEEVSSAEQEPISSSVEGTETVPEATETAPDPTQEAQVDEGPQPLQIARVQRTENGSVGTVLVDRDVETFWVATGDTPPQLAAFVLDLGEVQPLGSIRWLTASAGQLGMLYLSCSADGKNWIELTVVELAEPTTWYEEVIASECRFVRFAFINSEGHSALGGIAEVEVWP
jgi:uncharacterized protein YgiM (DUF1202 family)